MKPFSCALRVLVLVIAVVSALSTAADNRGSVTRPHHQVLRGRVVADVASVVHGAGVGPLWMSFIFGVESSGGILVPVKIAYAYYKSEQLPPDAFWDYSQRYELRVKREPQCDTTVQKISYERNVDLEGKELPPSFILRYAKGAPAKALAPDTDLPCYVLWYSDYKQVQTASEQ